MKNRKKGFSLVELIVAVAILAILAVYFSPSFVNTSSSTKEKSDDAIVKSLETEIAMASQNIDLYKIGRKIADESIDEIIKYTYVLDNNRMLTPEKCEIQTESGIVSSKDDTDLGRQMDDLLDEVDRYVGLNLDMSEMESELYRTQKYIINVQYKDLDYRVNTTVEMEDVGYDGYYNEPDEEDWGTVEEDELQTVMISFDPNGGTCQETSRTVQYGEDLGELPKAKKVGYIFSGWFTSPEGGIAVTPTTDATEDMTLYASYVADTNVSYKIRYWVQIRGADPSVENATNYTQFSQVTRNATANAEVPAELIAIDGYVTPEQKTITVMPDNSTVVDYYYKLKNHTIKFGALIDGTKVYTDIPLKVTISIDGLMRVQDVTSATVTVPYGSIYEISTKLTSGYAYTGTVAITPSNTTYVYDDTTGRVSGVVDGDLDILIGIQTASYQISYNGLEQADRPLPNNPSGYDMTTPTISLHNPTREGYHFVGWTGSNGMIPQINVNIPTGSMGDKFFTANWTESDSTLYTVKHWVQNVDGNAGTHDDLNYTLRDIEPFVGTTNAIVTPETKEYVGFNKPNTQSEMISADGRLEINYYYTRKSYSVTLTPTEGIELLSGQGSYLFEQPVTIQAIVKDGWVWDRWEGDMPSPNTMYKFAMPATNITNTATAHRGTYTITYNLNEGYVSGNPTKYTFHSDTIVLKNPTREKHVFIGWTGSNGTIPQINVNIPTGSEGNRIYTAHWEIDNNANGIPDKYEKKVTFNVVNGTWADGTVGEIVTYVELTDGSGKWSETGSGILEKPTGMLPYPQFKDGAWDQSVPSIVSGNTPAEYTYTFKYFTYTIAFVGNGGTGHMDTVTKTYKTDMTLPSNTYTRNGYAFVGWSLVRDGELAYRDGALLTADLTETANEVITLYAIWKIDTYNITYDYNGADSPLPENPTEYTINTPTFTLAAPTRVGYVFTGWTGSNGSTPTTSVSVAIGNQGPLTFKANWTESTNIQYVVNHWQQNADGTASSQDEINYTLVQSETLYGKTGLIVEPERKIYDGFIAPEIKSEVILSDGSMVIDYYYQREVYSITLEKDDGIEEVNGAAEYCWGSTVAITAKTKDSYTWNKWIGYQESTDKSFVFTMPMENITFKATTAENSYNIYYELNGGVEPGNPTVYTKDDEITLKNPTKTGYKFLGWTTTEQVDPQNPMVIQRGTIGDLMFFAEWETEVYTIEYNLNGGVFCSEHPTEYTIETNDIFVENPTKEGYIFLGWTGTDLVGNTKDIVIAKGSRGNKTYTANFAADNAIPYTVYHWTQNLDGNKDDKNADNYTCVEEEVLYGTTNSNANPSVKTFEGFKSPDVSSVTILEDGTATLNYYYERNSYTVTLNGDAGIETLSGAGTYLYEEELEISMVLKAGHSWNKWTGDIDSEQPIIPLTMPAKDITATATTTADVYTIEYIMRDDNSVAQAVQGSNPTTYTIDTETFELVNPTRTGYTFLGWTGSCGSTPQLSASITKGTVGDLLFVANWEMNIYTLTYDLYGNATGGTSTPEIGTANPTTYTVETPTFTLNNPTRTGYDFNGWIGTDVATANTAVSIVQGSIGNREYMANWKAKTNIPYVVRHYQQNLDDNNYTLVETENLVGEADRQVSPAVKSYTGFKQPDVQTKVIAADGSTIIEYKYPRETYVIALNKGTGIASVSGAGTYKYGESVTIDATVSTTGDFNWVNWTGSFTTTTKKYTFTATSNVTVTANAQETITFAVYSATDKSFRLYRSTTVPAAGSTYKGRAATAVYKGIDKTNLTDYEEQPWANYALSVKKVVVEDVIYPTNTAWWFGNMRNCPSFTVGNINMSKCINAEGMFRNAGRNGNVTISGCDRFESGTSTMKNVKNMGQMFNSAGRDYSVSMANLSNWNTSSCESMTFMFGDHSREGRINYDFGSWDVSSVKNFQRMFRATGKMREGKGFSLGALQKWNTKSATNMEGMFSETGKYSSGWSLNLSGWNVDNVTSYGDFNSLSPVTAPRWKH